MQQPLLAPVAHIVRSPTPVSGSAPQRIATPLDMARVRANQLGHSVPSLLGGLSTIFAAMIAFSSFAQPLQKPEPIPPAPIPGPSPKPLPPSPIPAPAPKPIPPAPQR